MDHDLMPLGLRLARQPGSILRIGHDREHYRCRQVERHLGMLRRHADIVEDYGNHRQVARISCRHGILQPQGQVMLAFWR
ncbi:MAG: hypothetical protein IPK59_01665 [Rhodospirillaceae bacterium]|nr:hypothetical protein [Rhodospirillaceae bacterium]